MNDLVSTVESVYGTLKQGLENYFDLELSKPNISVFDSQFYPDCLALFESSGKEGIVYFNDSLPNKLYIVGPIFAHELAHALVWQNNQFFYQRHNNSLTDKTLNLVNEGLALDSEVFGLKYLYNQKKINHFAYRFGLVLNYADSITFLKFRPKTANLAKRIVRYLKKSNVSLNDLILNPFSYLNLIHKRFKSKIERSKHGLLT